MHLNKRMNRYRRCGQSRSTAAVTAGLDRQEVCFRACRLISTPGEGSLVEAPGVESKVVESMFVAPPLPVSEVAEVDTREVGGDQADLEETVPPPVPEMEPFSPPEPAGAGRGFSSDWH